MNYIVMDLEWNQSITGREKESDRVPFEIIEIGAIKINDSNVMISEFNELVKPQIYHEMHYITSKLIHMKMKELDRGRFFQEVAEDFLEWCGEEEYLFCTWGSSDLTELQRNLDFYQLPPLAGGPMIFLDVQKLFAIAYEERKSRRALEHAIDILQIEKDIPFHRAFSDAYYTAKIFSRILEEKPETLKNVSYDLYHPPGSREEEVKVQFDTYQKYISRVFPDKKAAFADREVSACRCYICHRNLRKKIKWFSMMNGRYYYCAAYCEKHGYFRGKVRLYKEGKGVFAVKTTKQIGQKDLDILIQKKERVKEQRRKKRQHHPAEDVKI